MARRSIWIAALLLGVPAALAQPPAPRMGQAGAIHAAAASREAWQRPESWARLGKGMSRFDVFRILGEPGKVASYDGFERWEYPDLRGGRVNFDDAGALLSWRAPPGLRRPAVDPAPKTGP